MEKKYDENEIVEYPRPVIVGGPPYREIYDLPFDYEFEEEMANAEKRQIWFNIVMAAAVAIALLALSLWRP